MVLTRGARSEAERSLWVGAEGLDHERKSRNWVEAGKRESMNTKAVG